MNRLTQLWRRDEGENSIMQVITIAVSATLLTSGLIAFPGIIQQSRESAARFVVTQVVAIESEYLGKHGTYSPITPAILRKGSLVGATALDEKAAGCNDDVTSCSNIAVIPGFTSDDIAAAEALQYNCYSVFVRFKETVFYYQTQAIGSGDQIFKLGTPGTRNFPASPAALHSKDSDQVATEFPAGYSICHGNPQGLDSNWWPGTVNDIPWN